MADGAQSATALGQIHRPPQVADTLPVPPRRAVNRGASVASCLTKPPQALPSRRTSTAIARALLAWYDTHRRDLPWRRTRDPYAVWVSEMMLQQTQVKTVIDYYTRWMQRFPDVQALARADEHAVLHAWQGLGYYRRARHLHRGAELIVRDHGGRVPEQAAILRTLPGIGEYSAGAIASIAFGAKEPVVDGNVIRVLCRRFGLRGDPARAPLRGHLWSTAKTLLSDERPGDFNQALMELGATVCTPREPACARCPLRQGCVARIGNTVDELPQTAPRPTTVPVRRAAIVVWRRRRILLRRIPDDAPRWRGMWEFPTTDVPRREEPEATAARLVHEHFGVRAARVTPICVVRHSVTHYRITLSVFETKVTRGALPESPASRWMLPSELDGLALPAAQRRIAKSLQARFRSAPG